MAMGDGDGNKGRERVERECRAGQAWLGLKAERSVKEAGAAKAMEAGLGRGDDMAATMRIRGRLGLIDGALK